MLEVNVKHLFAIKTKLNSILSINKHAVRGNKLKTRSC